MSKQRIELLAKCTETGQKVGGRCCMPHKHGTVDFKGSNGQWAAARLCDKVSWDTTKMVAVGASLGEKTVQ